MLLYVYLPLCIYIRTNKYNIEMSNKHRISWLMVDRESKKNGDCSLQELDIT